MRTETVPMEPNSTQWSAYFPPGFEWLYEQMGLHARWANFSFDELKCKGSGALRVHYETMDKLQVLRQTLRQPIHVNSYYRCDWYNREVGGAEDSYHLQGRAVDTTLFNGNIAGRMKLVHICTVVGFRGFGLYENFNHIDTGRTRFWCDDKVEMFGTEEIQQTLHKMKGH